jgi:hypothetical protein
MGARRKPWLLLVKPDDREDKKAECNDAQWVRNLPVAHTQPNHDRKRRASWKRFEPATS